MPVSATCVCAHSSVASFAACTVAAQFTTHGALHEQLVVVLAIATVPTTDSTAELELLFCDVALVCLEVAGLAVRGRAARDIAKVTSQPQSQ